MRAHQKVSTAVAGLAAALLAAGCQPAMEGPAVPTGPGALSDANVAAVVSTVNEGVIEVAQVAVTKAEAAAVRQYAERIVEEHRAGGERLQNLLRQEGIQPASAPLTRDLDQANRSTLQTFRDYGSGSAFDEEFIEYEIEHHEWVIRALNDSLIPQTRDPELRAALEQLVTHMREHLNEARRVQRTL